MKTVKEGWPDRRPGDRVYHYMVEGTSLCGKIIFHLMLEDTIMAHGGGEKKKDDCAPCFKKLQKRLADQGKP